VDQRDAGTAYPDSPAALQSDFGISQLEKGRTVTAFTEKYPIFYKTKPEACGKKSVTSGFCFADYFYGFLLQENI
jgi:hypothetical protein